jgi:peptidoglycan/LPS O-acetylase OafA/YrhL
MSLIASWILLGSIAVLVIWEIVQFRRARLNSEEIPYPPRRLRRRILIGLLLAGAVIMASHWPAHARLAIHFGLLGILFSCILGAFALWWRDLSETSRAVVEEARKLDQDAGAELAALMRKRESQKSGDDQAQNH